MSDKTEDLKFANMHYPGMKSDPDEGRTPLDEAAKWRFAAQIACLGEHAQRNLMGASAFVLGSSPLGARIAKKILASGVGRVGIFGAQPLTGAHDFSSESQTGALSALSKWASAEAGWGTLESFSTKSVDRQLEDMIRGFDFVIECRDREGAREGLMLAREMGKTFLYVEMSGRKGCLAISAPDELCENCFELPPSQDAAGFYYAGLDLLASATVAAVLSRLTQSKPGSGATLELFDFEKSNWPVDTRPLKPKPGCGKCKKP